MHWQLGLLAVFINGLVAFFFLIGDIGLLEYKLKTVFEESLCQTYGSCLPLNAKYNHLPDVKLTVYFSTLSKLRTILDVWTIFLKIVKSVIQTFVLLKWASEILCTALCYDIETELWSRNLLATPCGHGYHLSAPPSSSHTRSTLAAVSKYLAVGGLRLTAFGLENKICGVR